MPEIAKNFWKHLSLMLALFLAIALVGIWLVSESGGTGASVDARLVQPLESGEDTPNQELDRVKQDREQLLEAVARAEAEQTRLAGELSAAKALNSDLLEQLERTKTDYSALDLESKQLHSERTDLFTRITDLIAGRQQVERQLEEVTNDRSGITAQLTEIRDERDELAASLAEVGKARERAAEQIVSLRQQVADLGLKISEQEEISVPEPTVEDRAAAGSRELSLVPPTELRDWHPPLPQSQTQQAQTQQAQAQQAQAQQASLDQEPSPESKPDQVGPTESSEASQESEPADTSETLIAVPKALKQGVELYKGGRYEQAFETWYPLAERGVRRAQYYIGSLYHEGRGVSEDPIKAYYWLALSDRAGYPEAHDMLAAVEQILTEAQISAAHKLLDTSEN